MEEVSLNETETRYYSDLFVCCDVEKTGKIPVLKATELFRSANLSNDAIRQITSLAGIPQTALHISRSQFYSCLKLIAAYQGSVTPLRPELISSSINLPLPRFSWKKESPTLPPRRQSIELASGGSNSTTNNNVAINSVIESSGSSTVIESNGLVTNDDGKLVKELGKREWREVRSPDFVELARSSAIAASTEISLGTPASVGVNSDLLSTDSEVEHNELTGKTNRRHRSGSPEAWSTNSDSPTPTNSVAERPWAKETMWQGLLGDEHRQLLGTEEESSDRHSSEEDNETDLETIYQITNEQREYYHKQFKAIQPEPNGLLSGHVARVFFEKSRIPVEELRHIWQLCDVTRDGALSLAEFTAAMHLVVLRRNNIPLPTVLPPCLHPTILSGNLHSQNEPPEADLLHLDDDDIGDGNNTIDGPTSIKSTKETELLRSSRPEKNVIALNAIGSGAQGFSSNKAHDKSALRSSPILSSSTKTRSVSNTPPAEPSSPTNLRTKELTKEWTNQNKEWTKFTESPTSNVSSPGPKPVNFDMQRTAQAVVSDPQILHPVPLRVTPVGAEAVDDDSSSRLSRKSENFVYDTTSGVLRETESSPKQNQQHSSHHRDSLQNNDLRAIQRPQAKKLPVKNIGAIPPPPQRESSIGSGNDSTNEVLSSVGTLPVSAVAGNNNLPLQNKKEPPPLPPPRPRHARSSSLDLNKLKLSGKHPTQPEITQQTSFDIHTESAATGFADFAHFPESSNKMVISEKLSASYIDPDTQSISNTSILQSNQTAVPPPPRPTISSLQTNQRASAFEVYRKPNTPRNSQSPDSQSQFQSLPQPPIPGNNIVGGSLLSVSGIPSTNSTNSSTSTNTITSALDYEKRVSAISETLRNVSINNKQDKNVNDVLRHLREQNILLLRLCNDLSQELLQVQERKEEARSKLDSLNGTLSASVIGGIAGGSNNISTNVTGGSGSSGAHSNV